MHRRRSERDARWRVDDELTDVCALIHEQLSEVTAEALSVPLQRPEASGHDGQMLLNGVYLVENAQQQTFFALIDELRREYESLGLELVPTGPWPAYNFVPGAIGATW
jgi:hypothetical protein